MIMKPTDVLCDSGVLISLTSSSLDQIPYFFSEKFGLRFIIPPCVEYETVTHPIDSDMKKYLFSAIRIKKSITDGVVIKVDASLDSRSKRLMKLANNIFFARGTPIKLIEQGESEMICLAKQLGVEYILVDERTTRILIEAPITLKEHFEHELGVNIMINKTNLKELTREISPLRVMRSSELVMLAYEKGFFKHYKNREKKALEAALYKLKDSGCSISFDEISTYLASVD